MNKYAKMSHLARAWQLVAAWMRELVSCRSGQQVRTARRKLGRYLFEPPPWGTTSEDERKEWEAFAHWLQLARHTGFVHKAWNEALHQVADKVADMALRRSDDQARKSWEDWLREGPASWSGGAIRKDLVACYGYSPCDSHLAPPQVCCRDAGQAPAGIGPGEKVFSVRCTIDGLSVTIVM